MRRRSIIIVVLLMALACSLELTGCNEGSDGDGADAAADGAGKPELLMFTQEGCPPCVPVHEIVSELEGELSDKVTFKTVHAENDFETFRKYGVQATPTIIILDSSGNVVRSFVGGSDKDTLKSELEKLL